MPGIINPWFITFFIHTFLFLTFQNNIWLFLQFRDQSQFSMQPTLIFVKVKIFLLDEKIDCPHSCIKVARAHNPWSVWGGTIIRLMMEIHAKTARNPIDFSLDDERPIGLTLFFEWRDKVHQFWENIFYTSSACTQPMICVRKDNNPTVFFQKVK